MFIPDLLLFTQQIANDTVIAKNEVKQFACSNIGMAVICTVLSFPLSKRYGALGSSLAIAISYMFTFVYMNVVYYRTLHLDIFSFFRQCYASFLIPYAITIIASLIIIPYVHIYGWIGFAAKAIIITVIYTISIWSLSLKKEEKEILLKTIFRR